MVEKYNYAGYEVEKDKSGWWWVGPYGHVDGGEPRWYATKEELIAALDHFGRRNLVALQEMYARWAKEGVPEWEHPSVTQELAASWAADLLEYVEGRQKFELTPVED